MKGSIVCRVLLCLLSLLRPGSLAGQVWDDFSDGDITSGVVWTGDTGAFMVSGGALKLSSSGSDSSFLSTGVVAMGDTMEWSVQVKLNFAPSSLNYLRLYLSSDQTNLKSPLNGYFLQLGETGGADAVVLSRQSGYTVFPLLRSRDSLVAQAGEIHLRVLRLPGGIWTLQTDPECDGSWFNEGSITDNSFTTFLYTGMKCVYTSTNASGFSFDDIYAGPFREDTIAPFLISASMAGDSSVLVRFSEAMDTSQVLTPAVYSIGGAGAPQTVYCADQTHTLIHLKYSQSLSTLFKPQLCVQQVSDEAGNVLSGNGCVDVHRFSPAVTGDLLFTEVMYDPSEAPSLPDAEYVEVYNRSDHSILLDGWELSDPTTTAVIIADTLHPGMYRVFCDQTHMNLFTAAGIDHVKGLSDFPSLNNTGDHLELRNAAGVVIDALTYSPEMYRDPLRDDHGWSIERIDENFPCHDEMNWKGSVAPSGGTPGSENSAAGLYEDTTGIWPSFVFPVDSLHLLIGFSEYPDTTGFNPGVVLSLSGYAGFISEAVWDPSLPQLMATVTMPMMPDKLYTLNISSSIADCAGNPLSRWNRIDFLLPSDSGIRDVRINEILFNPYPDGSDFVEVYNAGQQAVDLSHLRIAHADVWTGQAEDPVPFSSRPQLLMPGEYAVATEDITDIRSRYKVQDPRKLIQASLPSFNDDEGILVLLNPALQELERYHYRELHHFPLITDPEGVSLERISTLIPSDDSTNWHSAAETAGFATPGMRNSQAADITVNEQWLSATPVLFTPDNNGYHDVQQIDCHPSRPGFVVHLTLLNAQGVAVRSLARQELLGASGNWIWDGTDDSGQRLPPGIYVILAELFHIDGETRKYKTVTVLATPLANGK